MINVIVCQMNKPSRTMSVQEGTTIRSLLSQMGMDTAGKTFIVDGNANGPLSQTPDYFLQDGDKLRISAANAAA